MSVKFVPAPLGRRLHQSGRDEDARVMCGCFERFDVAAEAPLALAQGKFGDEILWVLDEGDVSHAMPPQIGRSQKLTS